MGLNPALRLMAAKKPAAAAGITFPITGVTNTFTGTVSPSFTLGTAPLENDIIFVFITYASVIGTTDVSGWTNPLGANVERDSDAHGSVAAYHRVTAGEAGASTVTWTLTNLLGANRTGNISAAVLRGVATSGELVGNAGGNGDGNTTTPWVIPTVTPTDTCQIVAGMSGDGTETQTTPGGWTLRASTTTNQSNYLYSRDTLGSNGVATGTTDVTPSTGNEYASIVACFKPA